MSRSIADLLTIAESVHYAAVNGHWPAWRQYERQDCLRAFRSAALDQGIEDKTTDMGFVVTKCLSMSGYGS